MPRLSDSPLGVYEKALMGGSWHEVFEQVNELGFAFMEMSIDESDERQARLTWGPDECAEFVRLKIQHGVRVPSMCLSANRAFPLGAADRTQRERGIEIVEQAIALADTIGVRLVQLAGYERYYDEESPDNSRNYVDSLTHCVSFAARYGVMLAVETMDTQFMGSISRILWSRSRIDPTPWLTIYPDLGNLSAWNDNPIQELELGLRTGVIPAIHLKDTLPVTCESDGQFRDVPFGTGCVQFQPLFRTLKRHSYVGPFVIEMWNRERKNNDAVREAKRWIEAIIERVDRH